MPRVLRSILPPKLRTLREFAEQEIIIPNGPHEGRRFTATRQPYAALWMDAIEHAADNGWNRFVSTGPTQSGKTLLCFVIIVLYHLFEIGEAVIVAAPNQDMAADKWRKDLLPVIRRSRYARFLPDSGGGSKGGKVAAIDFKNGASLRFMSGGGSDKSVAGYTARVVVITETDGMDESGEASREADRITQLEARTRSYGSSKRIYMECTVSIKTGRTWTEYTNGTESKIMVPCPHCREWITPERESLVGWSDAENEVDARDKAFYVCSACGEQITEEQRAEANRLAKLLHRGQKIVTDGAIEGDLPQTKTLGFRWNAFNNLFVTAADVGEDEYKASRSSDEENAEKEMRQFVWAVPYEPPAMEEQPLSSDAIVKRMSGLTKGYVPDDYSYLTIGVDIGKYLCHYTVIAWQDEARACIVDYDRFEVASDQLGTERALAIALREFRDRAEAGWAMQGGDPVLPNAVWIDAGYMGDVVSTFCREMTNVRRQIYLPTFGRGASQVQAQWYSHPKSTGAVVKRIGEGWHASWDKARGVHHIEVNSDHWKTWLHRRLATPTGNPMPAGAMVLFQELPRQHLSFAKHVTAETQVTEHVAGRGEMTIWKRLRKANHWLDASYLACAAGNFCGVKLAKDITQPRSARQVAEAAPSYGPDERPYLVTER